MKKRLTAAIIAATIGTSLILPTAKVFAEEVEVKIPEYNAISKDGYVEFKDVKLKHAINKSLYRKDLDQGLTQDDLSKIKKLYANFKGISDLDGIQYCTNLRTLELQDNKLTDITPLGSLKELRNLAININQIEDISPLANLTKLHDLIMGSNKIKDLTPITNLNNISYLLIGLNNISDLTPLKGKRNLKCLVADKNKIEDISILKDLKYLETVCISENKIRDISALKGLKRLTYILANDQKITLENKEVNGRLVLSKPVGFIDKNLELKAISDKGVTNNNNTAMIWNNINDNTLGEVKFSFNEDINIEVEDELVNKDGIKSSFSGEVVQPVTFNGYLQKLEDVNKDRNIDIQDIAALGVKYNSKSTEEDWNEELDLNKDHIIDIFDLVIVSKSI